MNFEFFLGKKLTAEESARKIYNNKRLITIYFARYHK